MSECYSNHAVRDHVTLFACLELHEKEEVTERGAGVVCQCGSHYGPRSGYSRRKMTRSCFQGDAQTDSEIDSQIGTQANRHTGRHTFKETGKQTATDRQTDRQIDRRARTEAHR